MKPDEAPLYLGEVKLMSEFPPEWEQKAFEKFLEIIMGKGGWKSQPKEFKRFWEENKSIKIDEEYLPKFSCDNAEICKIVERVFRELFLKEPNLYRILAHNLIEPEKLVERRAVFNLILKKAPKYLWDFLSFPLLEGSEPAEKLKTPGIPVQFFVFGKILKWLLDQFNHFSIVDTIKLRGAEESVEELRGIRGLQKGADGEWAIDYSPVYKMRFFKSGKVIYEVFSEEGYKRIPNYIDENLCIQIQNSSAGGPWQGFFYGSSFDKAEVRVILKYGDRKEEIPFQLLPKFGAFIGSRVKHEKGQPDQDRQQDAMMGLLRGGRTFNRAKAPATPWLLNNIKWGLLNAWKGESTTQIKEDQGNPLRLKRQKVEHSGGSLDDPITFEEGAEVTRKDLVTSNVLSPEEELLENERKFIPGDRRLRTILKLQEKGIPLSPKDRKYKSRKMREIKDKLG